MTDVTPPKPPSPKAAAKGLKGILKDKPAWMWVAGVTVLMGVAYLVWRNGQNTEPDATVEGYADEGPVAGEYGYGDEYVSPAATQGAFGGYDGFTDFEPLASDNAGEPEPAPALVINIPGLQGSQAETIPGVVPAMVTGGGPAARSAASHQAPPPKVNTTDNARSGRRYIEKVVDGWMWHYYESAPGKGDYGAKPGTKIKVRKVSGGSTAPPKGSGGSAPAPSAQSQGAAPERLWDSHPLRWWQNPSNAKRNGKWKWPDGKGYVHSREFRGN